MKYLVSLLLVMVSSSALAAAKTPMKNIALKDIKTVAIAIGDINANTPAKEDFKFRLTVYINGAERKNLAGTFPISPGALTDKWEKNRMPEMTPEGVFSPTRLEKDWSSRQFSGTALLGIIDLGAMPYSIFFKGGFAIHGSASTVDGKPASKGCVRLKKPNAKQVFEWVQAAINNNGGNKKAVKIYIKDTSSNDVFRYRRPKN